MKIIAVFVSFWNHFKVNSLQKRAPSIRLRFKHHQVRHLKCDEKWSNSRWINVRISVVPLEIGQGCPRCGGVVFAAELVLSKGREWHRKCFKCKDCNRTLDSIIACDGPDKDVRRICDFIEIKFINWYLYWFKIMVFSLGILQNVLWKELGTARYVMSMQNQHWPNRHWKAFLFVPCDFHFIRKTQFNLKQNGFQFSFQQVTVSLVDLASFKPMD